MCGIAGFCDFSRDNTAPLWGEIGIRMGETLNHRGPDGKGQWQGSAGVLVHRRLAVIDPENGAQPMERHLGTAPYVLTYNGELYNTPELRRALKAQGYTFTTRTDTEVLLYAYMEYGEEVGRHLEGIYAFVLWDGLQQKFFACRDRFGVKPLFYAKHGTTLIFASELKSLFQYPGLEPRADGDTWREVLGLGPARTPESGVFAGVKALAPGSWLTFDAAGVRKGRYWSLESRPHTDDYETTVERVRELVTGAITRQLVSDVPLCTFLSGGLDSSVITAVAARDYLRRGLPPLETYSFDYTDNEMYFKPSIFQPDNDAPWVKRMVETFHTRHTALTCPIPTLAELLPAAARYKDLPGMADVDASLLYFCGQVAKTHTVALSGECADEVFGGYPWFERSELLNAGTFPWCVDLSPRAEIFAPLWKTFHIEDYVNQTYRGWIASTPRLEGERAEDARQREVGWLNLNWFMATLLDRKDRMSMASGLEVRVPFCDYRLVEYVWNIPWGMKAMGGRRKQVLRDAAEGLLPEDVRLRPKSPYPKTHNPLYEQLVRAGVLTLLDDRDAPIHSLVDAEALRAGLLQNAGDYGKPWFGQLMAGPQMLAYLIQLNAWMLEFGLHL
ncbi:asparagine synthase (glutamine-hydrolyzing) [Candidatus Pseudoscillospira sp. SGI.172]|uniref:asparagine synthase (glutamine-hydrolyzing) n=1 Tax=Candidatus Pseudoscillospira sp. SGI.172 TaxID=3420582 RepID=UPI003D01AFEB